MISTDVIDQTKLLLRHQRRAWPIPLGPLILAAAAFPRPFG